MIQLYVNLQADHHLIEWYYYRYWCPGSVVEVVSGNESRRGIDMPKFLGSTNINITCITGIRLELFVVMLRLRIFLKVVDDDDRRLARFVRWQG